jgi:hypothetical protein
LSAPIPIDAHDALLSSRMSVAEWQRITAFRNRPTFLAGARAHEGVAKHLFTDNLILNKVVLEAWRFQMIALTLYLHEAYDPADPRTGLTVTNLTRLCQQLDLASSGRVFAFLNLMKLGGYLTSQRSAEDSRVVHLQPTAKFMTTVEEWTEGIFIAIDAAAPEGRLVERRAARFSLGTQMRTNGARGLIEGWKPLDPFPEVALFAGTDGGWMLIEQIVAPALRHAEGLRAEPVSINLRKFAGEVGGSRSNLNRLLNKAYEQGLLDVPPRGGAEIVLSSRMLCAFLAFIASYLSHYQQHTPTD